MDILNELGITQAQIIWAIALVAIVLLALTAFWISEIVDVMRREFPQPSYKIVWLLVLIFSHGLGALLYWTIGKRQGHLPGKKPVG